MIPTKVFISPRKELVSGVKRDSVMVSLRFPGIRLKIKLKHTAEKMAASIFTLELILALSVKIRDTVFMPRLYAQLGE